MKEIMKHVASVTVCHFVMAAGLGQVLWLIFFFMKNPAAVSMEYQQQFAYALIAGCGVLAVSFYIHLFSPRLCQKWTQAARTLARRIFKRGEQ